MFNRKREEEEGNDRSAQSEPMISEAISEVRRRDISVIGPTLRFKGELSANEDLVIEGHVEGRIAHQEKNLTIGKKGRVKADIHARIIDILGEVEGDVRGDEIVRLKASAVVNGNIHAPRVSMEDGAFFTGSVEMTGEKKAQRQETTSREKSTPPKLAVADTSQAEAPGSGG